VVIFGEALQNWLAGWLAGGEVRRRHTSQSFYRTCTMWCSQISSPFISSQDFIICTLLYFIIVADHHQQQQQQDTHSPGSPQPRRQNIMFGGDGDGLASFAVHVTVPGLA
jgi:hypothetical protein